MKAKPNLSLILLITVALYSFIFVSCDEIEAPYKKNVGPVTPPDSNKPKILLEEFTGHTCINCPKGARRAHEFENLYKDKFFVVSIHADFFAGPKPTPVTVNGETVTAYTYDFRTSVGNDLCENYSVSSYPSGMINRRKDNNGSAVLSWTNWDGAIANIFDNEETAEVSIKLAAKYDQTSRKITANVDLEYDFPQTNTNKISVWILEDGIVNWQKDEEANPTDVQNYVHNNVLRYSFNGTWGDNVSDDVIATGFTFNKTYSYTLPENSDWKPENLKVIAFVYDDVTGIKQVEKATVEELILTNAE